MQDTTNCPVWCRGARWKYRIRLLARHRIADLCSCEQQIWQLGHELGMAQSLQMQSGTPHILLVELIQSNSIKLTWNPRVGLGRERKLFSDRVVCTVVYV